MNMKVLGACALLAVTAPTVASAQTYNNFNPVTQTGTFGNNGSIGNSTFTNAFTFLLTTGGMLATDFTNTAVVDNGAGDIDFSSATLSGGTLLSPLAYSKVLGEPISRTEVWTVNAPTYLGLGTYTLSIAGRSYGSMATYTGNFNVMPVPEATTWAMMIGGVGMIGAMGRRRRKVAAKLQPA